MYISHRLSVVNFSLSCLFLFLLLTGCGGEEKEDASGGLYVPEGLDRRAEIRYKQYAVQGRLLYKEYCANCHKDDGTGLAKLIPPLANSDFLRNNPRQVICIIRHGLQGPITVNGTEYNQPMPPNPQLKPIEIAEIATYISNSWGNEGEFVTVQKAEDWLKNCEPAD